MPTPHELMMREIRESYERDFPVTGSAMEGTLTVPLPRGFTREEYTRVFPMARLGVRIENA